MPRRPLLGDIALIIALLIVFAILLLWITL